VFRKALIAPPLVLILAGPLHTQDSDKSSMPQGVHVNSFSTYAGAFPPISSESNPRSGTLSWLARGGASADVGWSSHSERTEASLDYLFSYNRTQGYSYLNGFDHALSFFVRHNATRRLSFSVDAAGSSMSASNLLFGSSNPGSDVGATALPEDTLSGNASSSSGIVLSAARYRNGSVGMGFKFSKSPRFFWQGEARVSHYGPEGGYHPGLGAASAYPVVTYGVAYYGFSYSLSRRSSIGASLVYTRSQSSLDSYKLPVGTVSLQRRLGLKSFLNVSIGYGRLIPLESVRTSMNRSPTNGYNASGTAGMQLRSHTLAVTGFRRMADQYGLGAGSTIGAEMGWGWKTRNDVWGAGSSLSYAFFQGDPSPLKAWTHRSSLRRSFTRQFSCVFEAAFTHETGPLSGNYLDLGRNGVRLSFVWSPGGIHAR
jgi:hypothetical protein